MTDTVPVRKTILLTGAGFSESFGGYLSSQMWAAIFNQPEISEFPQLQQCFLGTVDFEAVYDAVLYPGRRGKHFSNAAKSAFKDALLKTYLYMEGEIYRSRANAKLACEFFLKRFAGPRQGEYGFIFTLNQDLLVERYLSFPESLDSLWPRLRLPGIKVPKDIPYDQAIGIILPDRGDVGRIETDFWKDNTPCLSYIKLHGSFGWYSRRGEVMVIGNQKSTILKKEPLLRWYLKLFRQVLRRSRNLLAIGYGFRDPHINREIARATGRGLKLYVISPELPSAFRDRLIPHHGSISDPSDYGIKEDIWSGLAGYYQGTVKDFYDLKRDPKRSATEFFDQLF